VLKRRPKRRYISVMHGSSDNEALSTLVKRHSELFGHLSVEKASIRLVRPSENNMMVIKCNLGQLRMVLTSIALTNPPLVSVALSGSLKRLGRK
jgi:RNase P/RNase MRP subunit POP5